MICYSRKCNFTGNGWSSEDTRIVTERFVNDSTLLIEFADAIRS